MALITKEEVLKIAHMSRITIHEDEIDPLIKHLESVLSYAARVGQVATAEQAPLSQNINVFREDVAIPFNAERIKQEAPEIEENYFVVPAILEQE
jgi:aspartyl-tRNA(Asn)/glutamyl-tRNA(Gln) amidotransferase subunit C